MNVLFVTVAWPKEGECNLYSDLMHEFHQNGHTVYVAHADETVAEDRVKVEEGITVLRVSTLQLRKAGKFKKAISLATLGFKFKRSINKSFSDIDIHLIISHSPPITLSKLMIYLKKKYSAGFYYLLKDIWPHSSVDLGVIRKKGLIYHFFRYHEKRMYEAADKIGCMSPKNVSYIRKNNTYLDPKKVEVCPNTISPGVFSKKKPFNIRNKYDIPVDSTLFIFSGNLSKGHGLEYYLDTIESLQEYQKAYFAIGGSGTHYNYAKTEIQKRNLSNVFFYHRLPVEEFSQLLAASDVGIILLDSKYMVPQFPSRLLGYLEAGKPVLCAVNKKTDIGDIVESAECGISTIHGEMNSLVFAIKRLSENAALRDKFSKNARLLLEKEYTSGKAYNIILDSLQQNRKHNSKL